MSALTSQVRDIIAQCTPLSTQSWEALLPLLKIRTIANGDMIVREGQYYDMEIFPLKGIIRCFYETFDGQ